MASFCLCWKLHGPEGRSTDLTVPLVGGLTYCDPLFRWCVVPPGRHSAAPFHWGLVSPLLPLGFCVWVLRVFLGLSLRLSFSPPFPFSSCPLTVSLLRVAMAGFCGSGLAFASPVVPHGPVWGGIPAVTAL